MNELRSGNQEIWHSFFEKSKSHVIDNLAKKFADDISGNILAELEKHGFHCDDGDNFENLWVSTLNELSRVAFSIKDSRGLMAESNENGRKSDELLKQAVKALKDIDKATGALQLAVSNFNEITTNINANRGGVASSGNIRGNISTNHEQENTNA